MPDEDVQTLWTDNNAFPILGSTLAWKTLPESVLSNQSASQRIVGLVYFEIASLFVSQLSSTFQDPSLFSLNRGQLLSNETLFRWINEKKIVKSVSILTHHNLVRRYFCGLKTHKLKLRLNQLTFKFTRSI